MKRVVFDIETNGLLPTCTKLHCIVLYDEDNNQRHSYHGKSLLKAIEILNNADEIIGHNIMGFDCRAMKILYPSLWNPIGKIIDTLVISRLIYTTLGDMDRIVIARQIRQNKRPFSKKLIGRHSLEAWGHRLGFHKGDYVKDCEAKGIDPWENFNPEMLAYCENDVDLNVHLYRRFLSKNYSQQAIDIEHEMMSICLKQEEFGVAFDEKAANELYAMLCARREIVSTQLIQTFGSWLKRDKEFTPKRDNKRLGYKAGCTFTKVKEIEFNPGSRQHIADRLIKTYNWKPTVFTDAGGVRIDEKVLKGLKYPEVPLLLEYLFVNKRISQIAEAKGAWLKLVENGRIHGRVNPMGTISGRAAHASPNLGQVPAVSKCSKHTSLGINDPDCPKCFHREVGLKCRSSFIAPKGMAFVGADASGLELRCLAHYMARWDKGAYADQILNGDIHTANQEAAGLPTRDHAKTFIYGLLYGAGNGKIGEIIGKGAVAGGKLRKKFMESLPAYKNLTERVQIVAKNNGYLRGLDGRHLIIRSPHAALNQLLQGAGGVIMKQATINYHKILKDKGLINGIHYKQVLWVHDEWQIECPKEIQEIVGQAMVDGIKQVTEDFDFQCQLDGEYQVGINWAETH